MTTTGSSSAPAPPPPLGLDSRPTSVGSHRVVRFDLYGRGYSDRPKVRYDVELFKRQIFELTAALGMRAPLNLVALAFGAPIAIMIAEENPEQVKSLSFVAPDGLGVKMSFAAKIGYLPGVGETMLRVAGDRLLLSRLPEYSDDKDLVSRLAEHFEPTFGIKGFRRGLLSSIRNIPLHRAKASYKAVGESDIPVCVLWGDKDVITPFENAELMRRLLPASEFHSMPDVGHLPQYERPQETLEIISGFLERTTENA